MKHYDKLIELGCFSRSDLAGLLGNDATAGSMLYEYQNKGYIERVRRDLYTVISLETKQPVLSRYQIGCGIFKDATLSHHSAFEFYGFANQVFYEVYVATNSRFEDFAYNGISYHRVAPKSMMDTVQTGGVRVTNIEQTVVDSIADFEKIAGLEETLRCLLVIPTLDEARLIRILDERHNGYLWQKCGYILEELNDSFALSPDFFESCQKHIAGGRRALMKNAPQQQVWSKKWNLYVPRSLRELIDKGVSDHAV